MSKLSMEERAGQIATTPLRHQPSVALEHLRAVAAEARAEERKRCAWIARDHRHGRYCFEEHDPEACSCQEGIALKIEDPSRGPDAEKGGEDA